MPVGGDKTGQIQGERGSRRARARGRGRGSKIGTKLHLKPPTAERSHVLCVGVGGDRTHAARPGGAGYVRLCQLSMLGRRRGSNGTEPEHSRTLQNIPGRGGTHRMLGRRGTKTVRLGDSEESEPAAARIANLNGYPGRARNGFEPGRARTDDGGLLASARGAARRSGSREQASGCSPVTLARLQARLRDVGRPTPYARKGGQSRANRPEAPDSD